MGRLDGSAATDVLLMVDLLQAFDHEDGGRLLASVRSRADSLVATVRGVRAAGIPVVYANDDGGRFDGDGPGLVERALAGPAGDVIALVRPRPGDALILKPRYSAFIGTPLELLLRDLGVSRILLSGAATEMCVAQTAISARELGFQVSILAEACACIDERDERLTLDYLERIVGCRIVTDAADVIGAGQPSASDSFAAAVPDPSF
jgi:nicotinamidase-related amidase